MFGWLKRKRSYLPCIYRRRCDGREVSAFRLDDPTAKHFAESPGYFIDPATPLDWWLVLHGNTGGHLVLAPRLFEREYEAI